MAQHLACTIKSPPSAWRHHQVQLINNLCAFTYKKINQVVPGHMWTFQVISGTPDPDSYQPYHMQPPHLTLIKGPLRMDMAAPWTNYPVTHHETWPELPQCLNSESQSSNFTLPMMTTQSTLQVDSQAVTLTQKLAHIWILCFKALQNC